MKFLLSIFLMLMFSFTLMGQTPFSIQNSQTSEEVSGQQISLANPWFGGKLSYNLNEDAPLDDNFLFSAKVLYTPVKGDKFAVPVVGSAGLGSSDLLNPESGINIGVYPYYFLSTSSTFNLIAHGGIGYKIIAEGVETGEEAPQQIRLVGGLEAAFYGKSGGAPTTISITPVYLYNTLDLTENTTVLEITGILPIANGLGLMAEGQLPFNNAFDGAFRFGVIVNGQL